MLSLKQKELHEWQERNFGTHEDDVLKCALGMAEEVGEVCHHVLKGTQRIRSGVNGINAEQVADGVADTFIYGIQLLSVLGMNAEEVIAKTIDEVLTRDWTTNRKGENQPIQGENHV